ncbi:phage replisome organizer N-terminal domain-containing protein [Thomasclavelia cocleata]|uniref:phage replisome organizer N-terminal domain-containing protein n=1 Tax=Thomasclavelia cocleata TaxID=69824 RepID=UPI002570F4E8|nr:phage replisome organizer N-terminal domain-containing protein [Thomasclavelia cocleata]
MAKRYYWLKLSSDFFEDETIQFIEEQENGVEYVNFYLKLCLKSLKSNGSLIRLIGESYIPYDVKSLARLTGVNQDTVRVALQLFEKIGLVKFLDSGELYLTQINEMVGSETDKAKLMRKKRAKEKETKALESNEVTTDSNVVTEVLPKCYTESRVKSLDIRDIDKKDKTDDDFDKRYKIKDKSTDVHFITKLLLDDFLINEDEVKLFDSLITEYAKEFKAVDVKIKAKYILEKMLNRNINNRIAYFTKSMDKNLDEDYSLKTEIINNEDVNEDELNEALKQFE